MLTARAVVLIVMMMIPLYYFFPKYYYINNKPAKTIFLVGHEVVTPHDVSFHSARSGENYQSRFKISDSDEKDMLQSLHELQI